LRGCVTQKLDPNEPLLAAAVPMVRAPPNASDLPPPDFSQVAVVRNDCNQVETWLRGCR